MRQIMLEFTIFACAIQKIETVIKIENYCSFATIRNYCENNYRRRIRQGISVEKWANGVPSRSRPHYTTDIVD